MTENQEEQKKQWEKLKEDSSLKAIQEYFEKVYDLRNFKKDNIAEQMLLLTEEIGELAKAIRKEKTEVKIDTNRIDNYDSIENEMADVFLVMMGLCNNLKIDLFQAIHKKEEKNIIREWK